VLVGRDFFDVKDTEFVVNKLDTTGYPQIEETFTDVGVFSVSELSELLKASVATFKKEKWDKDSIIEDALIEIDSDSVNVVTTDRSRLMWNSAISGGRKECYCVVKSKGVAFLRRIMKDMKNDVVARMRVSDNYVSFVVGEYTIDIRLVKEMFPMYQMTLIETHESRNKVLIDRNEMMKALEELLEHYKDAKSYPESLTPIVYSFSGDRVVLTVSDRHDVIDTREIGFTPIEDRIEWDKLNGNMNGRFVYEYLASLPEGTTEVEWFVKELPKPMEFKVVVNGISYVLVKTPAGER
jgi:hypothetical protein